MTNREVYFPALADDIASWVQRKNWHWLRLLLAGLFLLVVAALLDLSGAAAPIFITILLIVTDLLNWLSMYRKVKAKEAKGEVLLLDKKGNERGRISTWFIIFLVLGGLIMLLGNFWLAIIMFLIGGNLGVRYFFHLPSIRLIINDDELILKRGFRKKYIDMTYPMRLRFTHNNIAFNHSVWGKTDWKFSNLNRDKVIKIKAFLSDYYGKEMILNPTTGLPYLD